MPVAAAACAVALLLSMDVSGSMSAQSYDLEREGLAHALEDPEVQSTVAHDGGIAVEVVMWASEQEVVIPWTTLTGDPEQMQALAARVRKIVRPYEDDASAFTNMGDAIAMGVTEIGKGPVCGKAVMDVSGDGKSNGGVYTVQQARQKAMDNGITINGLPVQSQEPGVLEYYRDVVITPDGFIQPASGEDDYGNALQQKLVQEVAVREGVSRIDFAAR